MQQTRQVTASHPQRVGPKVQRIRAPEVVEILTPIWPSLLRRRASPIAETFSHGPGEPADRTDVADEPAQDFVARRDARAMLDDHFVTASGLGEAGNFPRDGASLLAALVRLGRLSMHVEFECTPRSRLTADHEHRRSRLLRQPLELFESNSLRTAAADEHVVGPTCQCLFQSAQRRTSRSAAITSDAACGDASMRIGSTPAAMRAAAKGSESASALKEGELQCGMEVNVEGWAAPSLLAPRLRWWSEGSQTRVFDALLFGSVQIAEAEGEAVGDDGDAAQCHCRGGDRGRQSPLAAEPRAKRPGGGRDQHDVVPERPE